MSCKQKIYVGKKKSQNLACLISNSKIESSVNTWKTLFDFIKETYSFLLTFPLFPLLYKVTLNHSPICAPLAI